jgi:hypothetical protein
MYNNTDYLEMHMEEDGLGNYEHSGTDTFFSSLDKTYSSLVSKWQNIPANSVYTYKAYYKFYNRDLATA